MTVSMTPEVYEQKRNELVTLLDEVLALLDNIPVLPANRDKTRDELRRTRRKVFENQFTIALMAQFQGGKSTTFNALCDGMEISPRGARIKTSATVISAQNTTVDAEAGTAIVEWKSESELALIVGELALPHLRRESPDRFDDCASAEQLAGKIDFERDMGAIAAALEKEWELYKRGPADYSASGLLDALRIGSLICRHYDSDEIRKLREQKSFRVEEIGDLVRFPENFEERLGQLGADAFAAKECVFAFIREVRCRMRSENLARTGSAIIDCPGLFASRYDTRIAMDVLRRADAVWFLCGENALGESDLRIIGEVATIRSDTPFFTINMSGKKKSVFADSIRPADAEYLRHRVGMEIEEKDIHLYHALLALCAAQGEKLLAGKLDSHSKCAIAEMHKKINDGEPESVEAAWSDAVKDQLSILKVPERDEFSGLNRAGVDIARSVSGIADILPAIEGEVIRQKAASVLVHRGAEYVERELRAFEGQLKAAEEDALLNESEAVAEYKKCERMLDDFQVFARTQLKECGLEDTRIDDALAEDYWEKVLVPAVDAAVPKAVEKILELYKRIDKPSDGELCNVAGIEYEYTVDAHGISWTNDIQCEKNEQFNRHLLNNVTAFSNAIRKEWDLRRNADDAGRLSGLPELQIFSPKLINVGTLKDIKPVDRWLSESIITMAFMVLGGILGSYGGPLFMAIGIGTGGKAGRKVNELLADTEGVRKEFIKKLEERYREALEKNKQDILNRQKEYIAAYRKEFIMLLDDELEQQRTRLAEMKNRALSLARESKAAKEATAKQCNDIRLHRIEPVHHRMRTFLQSLVAFMPEEFEEVSCERA